MATDVPIGIIIGFVIWFLVRYLAGGFYTVDQNQRAVKTSFGRADRIPGATTLNDPISAALDAEEKERYQYPQVRVIMFSTLTERGAAITMEALTLGAENQKAAAQPPAA